MDITRFKSKVSELKDIANRARTCLFLDEYLKVEAEQAYHLILELQDEIRNQEIDEILFDRQVAKCMQPFT